MRYPDRAALLGRLALIRPEDRLRLLAFRETFLVRLIPQRLRADLRNLGILFSLLIEEASASGGSEAPGWPAGLRAAGDDLHACRQLLAELAEDLLAVAPSGSAYHRRARAMREIAGEIGRLADRLEDLRPKRARAPKSTPPEGPA